MPSCGKSTVGAIAAQMLGRDFIDADEEFEKQHGITPAEAIKTLGEDKFRLMETETLSELGKLRSKVIATGGGAVTQERNYPLLKQNGVIVFLERDLDKLSTEGRPISQKTNLKELYAKRYDAYCRFADVTVKSTEIKEKTASLIVEAFKNQFKG
jgi:shikimate dehydrogenase